VTSYNNWPSRCRIVTLAAFGQTLLTLKIYNARDVYYRLLALIASARTQPLSLKYPVYRSYKCKN